MSKSAIEGAAGIIVTSEDFQFGDTINVFDKSEKLLKQIIITDENEVLALKCLSKVNSFYKVELEDKSIGFIPRSEKEVSFQTWEEHILSVFSVGFDEANNPLLENPTENADKVYYDKNEFYHPSQIIGEWLQVKWGSASNWEYGWIKWKKGEKLLIELFYFA